MPKTTHLPPPSGAEPRLRNGEAAEPGSRRTFLTAIHRLGRKPEAEQEAELAVLMACDMGDVIGRRGECLEADLSRLGWARADIARLGEAARGHLLAARDADALRALQAEAA